MKSLSYKSNRYSATGDTSLVSPVIPPELGVQFRQAMLKLPWYELYVFDQNITALQCRIISVIRLFEENVGKRVSPKIDDIGFCVGVSRSMVLRALKSVALEQYLTIERSKGGNVYSFNDHQTRKVQVVEMHCCKACGRQRQIDKMNVCTICRKQDRANAEVARFLTDKPGATVEIVWLGLKSASSKCSAKEIHRAYDRTVDGRV